MNAAQQLDETVPRDGSRVLLTGRTARNVSLNARERRVVERAESEGLQIRTGRVAFCDGHRSSP
jgi:hypothetical protein